MNANQILVKFQMERYEIFKAQDPENDDFDTVFDINGKKLYAHKFMLSPISTTFKSMLSERWSKPDEPIAIKDYSFEDFKEFLIFIYSGECQLTESNIVAMVDMAEFYSVTLFKNYCERFLIKTEMSLENIFQMIQIVYKYSMDEFKKCVDLFILKNLSIIVKSEKFYSLEKALVLFLLESCQETSQQDELFNAIFKWAEIRESQKLDHSKSKKKTIKKELADLLPLIKFEKMNNDLFIKIIHKKSFLFSDNELDKILLARKKAYVKIIDEGGNEMKGELQSDEMDKVFEVIQSQRNIKPMITNPDPRYYYWSTGQDFPSTPSKLIKDGNAEWYLIYDDDGDLAIKRQIHINDGSDYLLAEMTAENGFKFSDECKIEVYRFV